MLAQNELAESQPAKVSRRWQVALILLLVVAQGCASAPPAAAPGAPPAAGGAPPAPAGTQSATAGGATVNVTTPAQPCCPHPTLWEFLGFKGLYTHLGGLFNRIRNRLGMLYPGLEAKPAMVAITDPSMQNSSNPAEAAAANAKADEDAAPQKIKAIRYLATLGCAGCYPNIEEALLAALDDCTEAVRYEAARALRENSGKPCATCKTKGCCSEKVMKKLDQVANKMEKGCYVESSARVRREARLAIAGCGNPPPPAQPANTDKPKEGPTGDPTAPMGATADDDKPDNADAAIATLLGKPDTKSKTSATGMVTETRTFGGGGCPCNRPGTITIQTPAADKTASDSAAGKSSDKGAVKTASRPKGTSSAQSPTLAKPNGDTGAEPSKLRTATAPVSVLRTSGAVLAEVNGQLIFESEVLPEVDRQLAQLGPAVSVEQKQQARPAYIRRELARVIDRKILCQEARRGAAAVTPVDYEQAPQDDESVAQDWLRSQIKMDDTVTGEQLKACYLATRDKYPEPAEVRYEQIIARFENFATAQEAQFAIEYARNRALGVKQPPAGTTRLQALEAETSGWMRKEKLPAGPLADALLAMPVGSISPVYTATDGYHVYRVLERKPASVAPLEKVIEQVRADVLKDRQTYLEEAYLSRVRGRAKIWTVFDK